MHVIPNRVALIGDIHGHVDVLVRQVNDAVAAGAELVFQLGDAGIHWTGGDAEQRRIHRLDEALILAGGVRLLIVMGNHDGWSRIEALPIGEGGVRWATDSKLFGYLPAGWRGRNGSRIVAALGGASSPDFDRRTEDEDWWPAETITDDDVEALVVGGHVDVLLTHDAPFSAGLKAATAGGSEHGFSADGIAYAVAGQKQLHRAFQAVTPHLVVSGHWHLALDTAETFDDLQGGQFESRSIILNMEGAEKSAILLSLDTLEIEYIENSGRKPKDISREFRAERRAAGLSSEEVASLLGISESAVGAIESGHLQVGEWVLDRLREA